MNMIGCSLMLLPLFKLISPEESEGVTIAWLSTSLLFSVVTTVLLTIKDMMYEMKEDNDIIKSEIQNIKEFTGLDQFN